MRTFLDYVSFQNICEISLSTATPLTDFSECAAMMNGTFGEMGAESEGSEGERVRALVNKYFNYLFDIKFKLNNKVT